MESDWKLQTEVKTLRSETALREYIDSLLPEESMRRPFTDADAAWLTENCWVVQDDRLLAIAHWEMLNTRQWFGVCRYVEHGDYKYLVFGMDHITKTRVFCACFRKKGRSVSLWVSRMAFVLVREKLKWQRKGKRKTSVASPAEDMWA